MACACAVLLLSPLLCFYFALYFASTLLNLIPNLIFLRVHPRGFVVFYHGGHALTTRNSGPAFLPPSRSLQSVTKKVTLSPCYTKKPQRYFSQACEKPPKWLLLHSHSGGVLSCLSYRSWLVAGGTTLQAICTCYLIPYHPKSFAVYTPI